MSEVNPESAYDNDVSSKSIFGKALSNAIKQTEADDAAAEATAAAEAQKIIDAEKIKNAIRAQIDYDNKIREGRRINDALAKAQTESTIQDIDLVNQIFDKICFQNGCIPKKLLHGFGPNENGFSCGHTMLNINYQGGGNEFKTKIDEILRDSLFSATTQISDKKMYDNFVAFLQKMNVTLAIQGNTAYCQIELHDTIGRYIKSESKGDRCNALKKFVDVIQKIVKYINENNSNTVIIRNGLQNYNSSLQDKIFNFPAKIENSGSGIKESYKACNNGSSMPMLIGGSKSRRIRRRKHNRKTHHKHARKTHHKRASKTHKRRRHSRSVRKHKKHTSRR